MAPEDPREMNIETVYNIYIYKIYIYYYEQTIRQKPKTCSRPFPETVSIEQKQRYRRDVPKENVNPRITNLTSLIRAMHQRASCYCDWRDTQLKAIAHKFT